MALIRSAPLAVPKDANSFMVFVPCPSSKKDSYFETITIIKLSSFNILGMFQEASKALATFFAGLDIWSAEGFVALNDNVGPAGWHLSIPGAKISREEFEAASDSCYEKLESHLRQRFGQMGYKGLLEMNFVRPHSD